MSNKKIYAIVDNASNHLYPDTHFFVLDSDVKAAYAFIVFAGKLNDTDISLYCIAKDDDDYFIDPDSIAPYCVCNFSDVIDFINKLDENELVRSGFTHKSFLHHYNIIISNINNFRRSLISDDKERSVTNE